MSIEQQPIPLHSKPFHNAVRGLVADGRFFTVKFRKKDGSLRVMNCRTGVHKYTTGGKLKYNPVDKGLLTVFEPGVGYRTINLKTIEEINANKYTLTVLHGIDQYSTKVIISKFYDNPKLPKPQSKINIETH